MNRIFKVIYSKTKHTCVVASELAKNHSQNKNLRGGVTSGRLLPGVLLAALLLTGAGSVSYAQGITIGGQNNTASGDYSSVSGGYLNTASGNHSSVSGGERNTASGLVSSVSGGSGNTASESYSSVSGGSGNTASGNGSSVSGGAFNTASFFDSSVSGGYRNTASGNSSSVSGGSGNTASGGNSSVSGGYSNKASGYSSSVSGGYGNTASGDNSSVSGGHFSKALGEESWAAGGATAYGQRSNAIGNGAVNTYKGNKDTAEKSMAIGYEATADTAGTISFGHDAGDASGYQVKWHKRTDGQRNPDGTYNDYTQAPESITETHYDSARYNRLVKVADGVDAHDAVVVEQLKTLAAASDASNIGTNLTKVPVTDAHGNIQYEESGAMKLRDATDEEKTANAESWGAAIGTGEVKSGDKKLVSGGAVYNEVHVDNDGNYIRSGNTVAENLEALDGKVKTNADNIEKNGLAIEKNSAAIDTNSQNIVKNGAAIEKNTADIATNAQNIVKNGAAIEKNTSDISTNAGNIEKNGAAIEKNTAAIATNAQNIVKNSAAIEKNSAAIATNAQNIEKNSAAIATNAQNIEKNGAAIEKNSAAIATNSNNIEKNGAAIEKNSAAIATNSKNIETISTTVEKTAARVETNSKNIEKNGLNIEKNTAAIATNSKNIEKNGRDIETLQQTKANISLSNINDAGKTVINNLAKESIDVKAGSSNVTVATNDVKDGVKTFTVDMAKDISVDSVTAKDVKTESLTVDKEATIGGVTIKDSKVTGLADTSIEKGSTSAVNAGTVYNETRVANDGHYIKAANTAGANITALDNQVAANAGNIFNLDNRVGELGSRINKVGAGAAALAALHPLDFDPSDKWDFAAGVGNYRNETAAAVGLFYRPNARSMFNLGWTMGDNRNMVNGGFSIKLGKGSVYNDMSKAQMAETIATQSKEISAMKADNAAIKADYNALKADNEAKEKRIDALEKQMQEIMAKLGK